VELTWYKYLFPHFSALCNLNIFFINLHLYTFVFLSILYDHEQPRWLFLYFVDHHFSSNQIQSYGHMFYLAAHISISYLHIYLASELVS